ncbi:hypothetical protein L1987_48705 [Smallanthus sonchifolius]|uniref:Uncharacterized protein n=1 Tax=Smallanthus sonchifolius TaxID=185202 RepID=A0ACB9FTS5_9ASTR|nr:hypothetical protein L1987_48705 [Smallanthus sonchifolius]
MNTIPLEEKSYWTNTESQRLSDFVVVSLAGVFSSIPVICWEWDLMVRKLEVARLRGEVSEEDNKLLEERWASIHRLREEVKVLNERESANVALLKEITDARVKLHKEKDDLEGQMGIPTAVEALMDNDDFLGRHEGLLVGYMAEVDIQSHPYFDLQVEAKLAGGNDTFDDAQFSMLQMLATFGKEGDFEGLKAYLCQIMDAPSGISGATS